MLVLWFRRVPLVLTVMLTACRARPPAPPPARIDPPNECVPITPELDAPAWAMLGYWFLLQLGGAAVAPAGEGGVAFWAHAGGFLAGLVLIPFFRNRDLIARRNRRYLFV